MAILLPVIIVGVIGLIAGIGLSVASKLMAVPIDEKEEKIRAALPGANCGACGYSGCDGYAAAVAKGEAEPNKCAPGGDSTAEAIAEILGVEVSAEKKIAYIACKGDDELRTRKFDYEGINTCAAAALLHGGPYSCKYGCLGFGDCYRACPFDAITFEGSKPIICEDLCLGCGQCVAACPKGIISLVDKNHKTLVNCSNKDKGAPVAKACKASCLACSLCVKACDKGAIEIVDNIPVINYEICDSCGKCIAACKRNVLM